VSINSGIDMRCSSAMWTLRSCRIVLRDSSADAADAFGRLVEFFGEREWFFAIELGEELTIIFTSPLPSEGRMRRCMGGRGRFCRVSAVRLIQP